MAQSFLSHFFLFLLTRVQIVLDSLLDCFCIPLQPVPKHTKRSRETGLSQRAHRTQSALVFLWVPFKSNPRWAPTVKQVRTRLPKQVFRLWKLLPFEVWHTCVQSDIPAVAGHGNRWLRVVHSKDVLNDLNSRSLCLAATDCSKEPPLFSLSEAWGASSPVNEH